MDGELRNKYLLAWLTTEQLGDILAFPEGQARGSGWWLLAGTVESETMPLGLWVAVERIENEEGTPLQPTEDVAGSWMVIPWDCLRRARLYPKRTDAPRPGFRPR